MPAGRNGTYTWWGPDSVPLGNEAVLFAWGDARYGNVDTAANDVLLATMQLGDPGPPEIVELPKASPANLPVAVSQRVYSGGLRAHRVHLHVQGGRRPQGRRGRRLGPVRSWPGPTTRPFSWVGGDTLTKEQKAEMAPGTLVADHVQADGAHPRSWSTRSPRPA